MSSVLDKASEPEDGGLGWRWLQRKGQQGRGGNHKSGASEEQEAHVAGEEQGVGRG